LYPNALFRAGSAPSSGSSFSGASTSGAPLRQRPHQFRRQQFLFIRRAPVLREKIAEGTDVFLEATVGEITAVPRQHLGAAAGKGRCRPSSG
jgi:hypothetical protein